MTHTWGLLVERDRRGRSLPDWRGCRVLGHGDSFLMNSHEPASLDGRLLPVAAIIGTAVSLWVF